MKKIYIAIAIILLSAVSVSAQNFRTGYFLDGYMYKYKFNPAFQGERGFISLPALGRTSVGVESNLALSTFLYPGTDGRMQTFLHPNVSDETFMSRIKDVNPTSVNADLNILALGFRAGKTYHTIDFSLRADVDAALPGDVFRFLKSGGSAGNTTYNLSALSASVNSYLQAAYGFSIKIKDIASVGFRAKFLMGVQSFRSEINDLTLSMSQDKWMVNAGGNIIASSMVGGLIQGAEPDIQGELQSLYKTPSMGAAFDLGFTVDFLKHFTVSASILDVGFISWKNMNRYKFDSEPWEYTGFDNISIEGGSGASLDEQLDSKLESLGAMFKFENPESIDKHMQMLGMTAMLGLEFRMPFYNRLSIGALGTHRFEGSHSWTEGRFSLNLAPARWFSIAANYAISTFGHSYGAALNLHPKGFNLFVGVDSFRPLLNVTPQFIPIDEINTNLEFGITFPFGKYNGRFPKGDKPNKMEGKTKVKVKNQAK